MKGLICAITILLSAIWLVGCGATGKQNCNAMAVIGGSGTPAIVFTFVPALGSTDNLKGKVSHVAPASYAVVVYIYVADSGGWWVKPYADNNGPTLTAINCGDGTFETDITTGGNDQNATQIMAFLTPATYSPPFYGGIYGIGNVGQTLPNELYQNAVAYASANR